MKNKKKIKVLIVTLLIFAIIFIICVVLIKYFNKFSNTNVYNKDWMQLSELENNTYLRNQDAGQNKCQKSYYSSSFEIKDGTLIDDSNTTIMEEVYSVFMQSYGECEMQLTFITDFNGTFYYLNNIVDNDYEKYQLVKIDDVEYVTNVIVNYNDLSLSAVTNSGEEVNISSTIDSKIKYLKEDEENN